MVIVFIATVPTPCYVVDLGALRRNLELLADVKQRTGCRMLLKHQAEMLGVTLEKTAVSPIHLGQPEIDALLQHRRVGRAAPGVRLPVRPFFGNMGVSPPMGRIGSAAPGFHAGNLDNKELVAAVEKALQSP